MAILAGGLATRLHPITQTIPKALVPVAGKPFLAHQLKLLARNNVRDIVLCVGYLGNQIEEVFGDGRDFGVQLRYCHDGPELRGTAGALRQALPLLGKSFLVLYGDSYLDINYATVIKKFIEGNEVALMTVIENSRGTEPSNVWLKDQRVLAYNKKHPQVQMRHIDYGLSAYRTECLEEYEGSDLSDLQSQLAGQSLLAGFEVSTPYYEIGSHNGLKALEDYFHRQQSRL
jgi:NDP-sugar pyrophosphorylase family protein